MTEVTKRALLVFVGTTGSCSIDDLVLQWKNYLESHGIEVIHKPSISERARFTYRARIRFSEHMLKQHFNLDHDAAPVAPRPPLSMPAILLQAADYNVRAQVSLLGHPNTGKSLFMKLFAMLTPPAGTDIKHVFVELDESCNYPDLSAMNDALAQIKDRVVVEFRHHTIKLHTTQEDWEKLHEF